MAVFLLLAVLNALCGCDSDEPPKPQRPERPSAISAEQREETARDAAAPARSVKAVSPVPEPVLEIRRQLDLERRTTPTPHLALALPYLARLGSEALLIYDLRRRPVELVERVPLQEPRAVARRYPRGFVALSANSTLVWDGKERHFRAPKITYLPNSQLLADREHLNRVWVFHASGPSLYAYDLDKESESLLGIARFIDLEERGGLAAGGSLTSLAGGSFVYGRAEQWARVYRFGKVTELKTPAIGEGPLRLFAAPRVTQLWVAGRSTLALWSVAGEPVRQLREIDLGRDVYDLSIDEMIAQVHVSVRGERVFKLVVNDLKGASRFEAELQRSLDLQEERWAQRLSDSLGVVTAGQMVAVGGPEHLDLYDIDLAQALELAP